MVVRSLMWLSFSLIVFTYFGYYLVLLVLSGLRNKNRFYDDAYTPYVSMVVSAYNEKRVIQKKIDNFYKLKYPLKRIELLIGSDGSDDGTERILIDNQSSMIHPFIFDTRCGKASVLNRLVDRARGDIIVFSDANSMYAPDAIQKLVKYFKDPKIGGVCGMLELYTNFDNAGSKGEMVYWNFENRIKDMESRIRTVFGANGAIYAIRRSLYERLPEDVVITDDFILPMWIVAKGYDVVYDKDAKAYESTSSDVRSEFIRKVRIGAQNFYTLKEIIPLLNPFKGFVAFGLWSHKVLRWFAPFFLIFLFLTNLALIKIPFYRILFLLQLVFYLSASVGWLFSKMNARSNIFTYVYYFLMVNFAILFGFIKFLFRSQRITWEHVDRSG